MKVVLLLAMVAVSLPVLRIGFGLMFAGWVGRKALSKQADTIHLVAAGQSPWTNAYAANALVGPLMGRGFADAGIHTIPEMPGLVLQLLVHAGDSLYATVYEHPKVGTWVEMVTRFEDGTASSFTTSKSTGLDPQPGHPVVHAPGVTPLELLARARNERPSKPMMSVSTSHAVADFEQGYAESIAWRKSKGISTSEVARVAAKRELKKAA
jgi:hypothetical protein